MSFVLSFMRMYRGSKSPTVKVQDNDHNQGPRGADENGGGEEWIEMPNSQGSCRCRGVRGFSA